MIHIKLFRFRSLRYSFRLVRRVVQLPRTGNTRFHFEGLPLLRSVELYNLGVLRTRPYQGKIPYKQIEELRDFVNLRRSKKAPHSCNSRVASCRDGTSEAISTAHHTAKFPHAEPQAVFAYAPSSLEATTRRPPGHAQAAHNQQGTDHAQNNNRNNYR